MMGDAAENIYPMHDGIAIPPVNDAEPVTPDRVVEPVIFGLTSATGGAGVTTLALQMAYHAAGSVGKANEMPTRRVALLSLDFENSALAYYLDVAPKVSAEHFCQTPEVMDKQHCLGWMSDTGKGFDILALPASVDGNAKVNPNSVLHFLDLVAQNYDVIILDIPQIWMRWTHAALGAADKVAFVTELNIPALHLTRERYAALVKLIPSLEKSDVVLNKYEKRSLRNSLSLNDAHNSFRNIDVHTVPSDPVRIREAINRGEPIGFGSKNLKSVGEINAIFDKWMTSHLEEKGDFFMQL